MPRWTRLCGSTSVMSRPSRRIWPAVGRSTPVNRLTIVVLPAPLGPINAWRAPFSILSETSLVATMPPNRFTNPQVSSTVAITSIAVNRGGADRAHPTRRARRDARHKRAEQIEPAGHALAADQDDNHQDEPDPELPILRGE